MTRRRWQVAALAGLAVAIAVGALAATSYVQRYRIRYTYAADAYRTCALRVNGAVWIGDVATSAIACPSPDQPSARCTDTSMTVVGGGTYLFQLVCEPLDATLPAISSNILTVVAPEPAPSPAASGTALPAPTSTPSPAATRTGTASPPSSATATPIRTASPSASPPPPLLLNAIPITNLAQLGTPIARVTAPTGIGSKSLYTLLDGVTPPAGTTTAALQYDTYDGANTAVSDYVGVTWATTQTVARVVFQEGMHFADGGWFTQPPILWVRLGGTWQGMNATLAPAYTKSNPNFTRYTFTLPMPLQTDGIMIVGIPGGASQFISCAELEVQ